MKRFLIILLCLAMLLPAFSGCGKQKEEEIKMLSFSQAESVDEMQNYDGQKVTIIGYMSTLSPINGNFMYLMNLPYQSCPFCVPNTTQLSNTMAVYAKDGDEFEFTDSAIQVTGIMEFGDYTDEFGYEYGYRIKDAEYSVVDTSDMSEKLALWQQLAATDVISDVYSMYEYLNFLCYWPGYTAEFGDGEDYLYPSDALYFIQEDGAQYNYGYADGYFDNIIADIKEVNETAFADLVANIESAKAFAEKALAELTAENYTQVEEYSGAFNDGRGQYKMNLSEELETEMETLYRAFSEWLSGWEL
ncbi:MAG: hypothetical protein IJD17_07095 [Clostridia bacterium]|nr:hypothetical protein [Clostridia bacterium]